MSRFMFTVLLMLSGAAHALPVDLSHALYSVSTYAQLDADSDGIHAADSPPAALPVFSHAALVGADLDVDEFAHADALADVGFLGVSSETQGSLHHAGVVAQASLEQALELAATYVLTLDFEALLELAGADGSTSLTLAISVGAQTLFDEIFTDTQSITRRFALAPGEQGIVHVGLVGSMDSLGDGGAGALYGFSLASVDVSLNAVPTPNALSLMVAGLLPLWRRRRASRA